MASTAAPAGAASDVRRYQLFINGKFVDAKSGKTFESINPHDRSVVAVIAEGDKADIDLAVKAARKAFEEFGKVTKSTPQGSIDRPLNPIKVALGANALTVGGNDLSTTDQVFCLTLIKSSRSDQ